MVGEGGWKVGGGCIMHIMAFGVVGRRGGYVNVGWI